MEAYWYCEECGTKHKFEIYQEKQFCTKCKKEFDWDWDIEDDFGELICWIRKNNERNRRSKTSDN